ncbi:MAG: hypothetical protein ACRDN9_14380 [Streptosporangiaceae bacterium]
MTNDITLLAEVARDLSRAEATIDRLVASDNEEISYAATTTALHLHVAQAELHALAPSTSTPPTDGVGTTPDDLPVAEVTQALARAAASLNEHLTSLPAEQRLAAARIALHAAVAADALRGVPT